MIPQMTPAAHHGNIDAGDAGRDRDGNNVGVGVAPRRFHGLLLHHVV